MENQELYRKILKEKDEHREQEKARLKEKCRRIFKDMPMNCKALIGKFKWDVLVLQESLDEMAMALVVLEEKL